jgi:acetyl esterase/lipase
MSAVIDGPSLGETGAGGLPAAWLGQTKLIGPAHPTTKLAALACRTMGKPVIFSATMAGKVINGFDANILQSVSLAGLDAPRLLSPPAVGTTVRRVLLPSCKAEWIHPTGRRTSRAAIVYFHGSAFVALGLNSHRPFVSRLVRMSGVPALNVDYGLRPLADLEDAVQQGVDAYEHVLRRGVDPSRVVFAGDSAGGFLAALVAIRLRDLGKPRPAGQILLSPVTDNDMEPKLTAARARPDDMFPMATLRFLHEVYITRNGAVEADRGPAQHDLAGLAPFLIQVGSNEMLRPDAELLTARLRASGVHADLEVWDSAPHVFQIGGQLVDAQSATRSIVSYLTRMTQSGPAQPARRRRPFWQRETRGNVVTLPARR